MTLIKDITQDNFEQEVLNAQGTVLVDFYAPWCGPCKIIAPVLEQVAQSHQDVKIVKVDTDQAPELMTQFGVRGIPTLLLLKDGEAVDRKVGAASLKQVTEFISQ